jgi:phosphoglycolate phosphatase
MRVCLFDIDGTLLNSGGAGQAAMEAALEVAFGVTAPTEGIAVAGRTDRAITADLMLFHGIAETDENRARFTQTYLSHLPQVLAASDGLVLPGVRELLAELSQQANGVMGLLTGNFRRGAEAKLTHYELLHYFQCGGFGDHHHHRDDVARAALADFRQQFKDTELTSLIVIGDTPADVQCGRAIGARVIAVATGIVSREQLAATDPDYLFDDFSDAGRVLEALLAD